MTLTLWILLGDEQMEVPSMVAYKLVSQWQTTRAMNLRVGDKPVTNFAAAVPDRQQQIERNGRTS